MKRFAFGLLLVSCFYFVEAVAGEAKTTDPGGVTFTLVTPMELQTLGIDFKRFGKAWKEPQGAEGQDGAIWGDMIVDLDGSPTELLNHSAALAFCKKIGAQLPSQEDFERLRSHMGATEASEKGYVPQVLPNLSYIPVYQTGEKGHELGRDYWTTTRYDDDEPVFYLAFDGKWGHFTHYSRVYRFAATRCIWKK